MGKGNKGGGERKKEKKKGGKKKIKSIMGKKWGGGYRGKMAVAAANSPNHGPFLAS